MAREVFGTSAAARGVFERASGAAGRDLAAMCFSDDPHALAATSEAQPALLTAEAAVLAALREAGMPDPDFAAGHSLGEFAALHAAGSLALEDAVRAVSERGRLMDEAGNGTPGGMAAVIGLGRAETEKAIEDAGLSSTLWVANVNSDDQVVVSGVLDSVERIVPAARNRGAKKVVRLRVAGAFHTPLMAHAAEAFEKVLDATAVSDPRFPVVANSSAVRNDTAAGVRGALTRHMTSPVLWADSIRCMAAAGVAAFVEAGPGAVLSGLVKKVVPGAAVVNVERPADMDRALALVARDF